MADAPARPNIELTGARLKAMAHPMRVRLLQVLRDDGPRTATQLAEFVGESSGVTSYHLRQLAQHGFVVEDTTLGNARERWWRAAPVGTTLSAPAIRENMTDAETYMRAVALQDAERIDRWLDGLHRVPAAWEEGATLSTSRKRLTPAQAEEVISAFTAILDALPDDKLDIASGGDTEDAARVYVQFQVLPFVADPGGSR